MRDICDIIIQKQPTGSEFETDSLYALQKSCTSLKNCIGSDIDKNEGTDFIYQDLRLDATLDFEHKDNMPFAFDTGIPAATGQNFQMGIRIGNNHKGYTEFPEPVVVIGLCMDSHTYRLYQDNILENMIKNADDLMFAANDAYLDYITTDDKEREELFTQPLRTNNRYETPHNISEKFDTLNKQQYMLMQNNKKEDIEYA